MILCSCNRISDRDVTKARQAGANNPKQVYQFLGVKPKCGSCIQSISEELQIELHEHHFNLAKSA